MQPDNSNLVVIRSVYRVTKMLVEPARHPKTNRYADCVRTLDSNGNMILSDADRKKDISLFIPEDKAIEIYDGKTFDLNDPYEAAQWDAIKYSRRIAKARDEKDETGNLVIDGNAVRYGNAEFYVEIPGLEAKAISSKKRKIHEAEAYIYNDTYEGLYTKARVLGMMVKGLSHSEVEQELIKRAQIKPEQVKDLYEGKETYFRILFVDALDKNVIKKRDNLFYYGDLLLGSNEETVINYMRNPETKTIMDTIRAEVYGEDYVTRDQTTEVTKEIKETKSNKGK
jgi:hypothetical protein